MSYGTSVNYFISYLAASLTEGGAEEEIFLSTITTLTGEVITTADFATLGLGEITIDPLSTTSIESCTFTGVDGTDLSLTGVTRGLSAKGDDTSAVRKKYHPIGTTVIITFGSHSVNAFKNMSTMVGPSSSTDNAIARFDGITGKLLQNSAVTIDDNGNINGSANLTENYNLFRQAIINGNFDIWQRGTSFTNPSVGAYLADRWANVLGGGTTTVTRQTTGIPVGSTYCLRITQTDLSFLNVAQVLESSTVDKIKGKTVTFSVKVRRNDTLTTGISLIIEKNATADTLTGGTWSTVGYTTVTNANIPTGTTSSDWYDLTITVTIPTDGTANGIRIQLNYMSLSPNGGYVEYAQVQLCAGSVALPFQPKSYAEELRDCQRYYQTRVVRTINGIMNYGLPEDLRTTPTTATASAGTIANATATGYQITHNANANSTVVLSSEL